MSRNRHTFRLHLMKCVREQGENEFPKPYEHDIRTPLNGIIGLLKIDETHFEDKSTDTGKS